MLGLYITNIYVSPQLEIRTDETQLITRDIIIKHPMIGVKDLIINRTGKIIEKWLDEENFITLKNYEATHKDDGTLDVHIADTKLTSLFYKFCVFSETPSDHYPTVSNYYIDKPIQPHKKFNWEKYKNRILHISDNKVTKNIPAAYKEDEYVNIHVNTNHQIRRLTRHKHKLDRKRKNLRRNDEQKTTQHQKICNQINILTKEIKKISKENATRQQMKLIDKLNQARKCNNL